MNDSIDKLKPSGGYVKCWHALLDSRDLSPEEKILWLLVARHCIDSADCYPSVERLRIGLGKSYRWTSELLKALERKGWLHIEKRQGRASIYTPLIVEPRKSTSRVDTSNLGSPLPGLVSTSEVHFQGGRNSTSGDPGSPLPTNKIKGNRLTERDISAVQSEDTTPKKKTRKSNSRPPKDLATLQTMLDEIDLQPFREKWEPKGVNVAEVWERFSEVTSSGTPQKPEPNPYGYRDLKLAFGNWCWKEAERSDKKQPSRTPDSPGPSYPDLSNYKI